VGQESPNISLRVGGSVLTLVPYWEAGEALMVETTSDGETRHPMEGLFDAVTVDDGSHWAVGGVLPELTASVEAEYEGRDLQVQTDGQAWLAVVPSGDNDELVLTYKLEGRVLHRSQVNVREFLPRPPTYYAPID
jgi:hypothetical protein